MSQGCGAAGLTLLGLQKRARVLTTACLVKRTATPAWKLLWTMGRPGDDHVAKQFSEEEGVPLLGGRRDFYDG